MLQPREQKLTPELLAMLFQDRYAINSPRFIQYEFDRPKPWNEIGEERRELLVEVFRQLQGLFLDTGDPGVIWASSIVSHKTGEGLVQLQWGGMAAQMPVEDARHIALDLLEAAESAETDHVVLAIFRGLESVEGEQMATNLLVQMRNLREERRKARIEKTAKDSEKE